MSFNTNIWKRISKKEKIYFITFLSLVGILILSFLLYFFIPRLTYTYDSDSDTYIVKKAYGLSNSYTIPSMHNNKEVSAIGPRAFEGMSNLEEIIFESDSNLITIDRRAFYETGLTSITLPDSVTYIYEDAFAYSNLESFYTSSNSSYEDVAGSTFFYCQNLKNVEIPNCKTIGSLAFYNCLSLESLTFPNNDVIIYSKAFMNDTITLYVISNTYFHTDYDYNATITIVLI